MSARLQSLASVHNIKRRRIAESSRPGGGEPDGPGQGMLQAMSRPRFIFTLTANVSSTSDGQGYLVALPELHLTTWVASPEHVERELGALLRGFVQAERARGTL